VAALNPPLCVLVDARAFAQELGDFRVRSGWVPEEASSAQPLQVWLHESEGGRVGFNVMTGLDPGYPQCRPYQASEGTYPGRGQGELEEGKSHGLVDKEFPCV
jgi:hypothetical protein